MQFTALLLLLLCLLLLLPLILFLNPPTPPHDLLPYPSSPVNASILHSLCSNRWIYVLPLPNKFNLDLLTSCSHFKSNFNLCPFTENGGMGQSLRFGPGDGGPNASGVAANPWFNTWQFSLEMYFHDRLLNHPCRTRSEEKAVAFFVPFYAGIDLLQRITNRLARDSLYLELVVWLRATSAWRRHSGLDHFIVVGRIAKDFRTRKGSTWGSQMLLHSDWQRMLKLTIERNGSAPAMSDTEIAIPYPTAFHASTDFQLRDLVAWASRSSQRSIFSILVGGKRRNGGIRTRLISECESDSNCTLCICSDFPSSDARFGLLSRAFLQGENLNVSCSDPILLLTLYYKSQFCLQPPGDSPSRRSFFDSIIAGCIPVIFNRNSAWTQYLSHLPGDGSLYSVFIPRRSLRQQSVTKILQGIPEGKVNLMRAEIGRLLPKILYAHVERKYGLSGEDIGSLLEGQDAFDIAMDAMLAKVRSRISLI